MNGEPQQQVIAYMDEAERAEFSVAMQIGFGGSEKSYLKISLCIALYAALAFIWLPGFSLGTNPPLVTAEDSTPMRRKVLKPPAEKPLQRAKTREKKARKVPMPDITPNDPEPTIVAEAIEVPDVLPTDDWEIGIPDGPPINQTVAQVGNPGVDAPIFTRKVAPNYPQKGVEIRLQGYVILQAILRKDGTVDAISVLRGLGKGKFGFEDEAIASLKEWEFLPGRLNGSPADVRMNLRVDFILN